jgi:hypothetical protein
MYHRIVCHIVILISCFFLPSCAYIQVAKQANRGFNHHSTSGALQLGMKDSDVKQILGEPEKVSARKTNSDVRTVWMYRQYYMRDPGGYFLAGLLTFGVFWAFPANSEWHHLAFNNGVLIGWDMDDPYAPDLIIEKRER